MKKSRFNLKLGPDSGLIWFVVNNMMCGKPHSWQDQTNYGRGDALSRTGQAYIIYGHPILKKGIFSCFVPSNKFNQSSKGWLQAYRYPGEGSEDVSRDAVVNALIGLWFNRDEKDFKLISDGIRWRLSKRYTQTIDMWLWHRSIATNNRLYAALYSLISIFNNLFCAGLNSLVLKLSGFKTVNQKDFKATSEKELIKFQRICRDIINSVKPTYSIHHHAWQTYSTPQNIFKWLHKKTGLLLVEKSNYVCRLLFGATVVARDIRAYECMDGFRWSRRLDESTNIDLAIASKDEVRFNAMDRDMLIMLYNKLASI